MQPSGVRGPGVTGADGLDRLRGRLRFRSWHRGTLESDLLLGRFADAHMGQLDAGQLDRLDALLETPDADLYGWIVGREPPPPAHDNDVLRLLRAFVGGAVSD